MKENNFLNKEHIKYIVVHCSDTDKKDTSIDLHKLHIKFGWDGIGYHKIILENGKIENGRPEYWKGAHVYNFNDQSLGVCLIGKDNFTENQFNSLKKVLQHWKKKYPNAKIVGHNEFEYTNKTCPNFDLKGWLVKEYI